MSDVSVVLQEVSDAELEVEEVEGTGMVGGTYRLLAAGPSLASYVDADDCSDVEVGPPTVFYTQVCVYLVVMRLP